jgi:hypothetical protein
MATYAKISNKEFTVSERARLQDAKDDKNVIEAANKSSAEYAALKTAYEDSFTSATLQTLEGELAALQSQYTKDMSEEEITALDASVTAKQAEVDGEKAALVPGQETALANLKAKEAEGTEALNSEIETLNTAIANALCRVSTVYPAVDEIEMVAGDSSAIDAEIKELEETQRNLDWGDSPKPPAESSVIDAQIAAKLEEKKNIPLVEKDNTLYWEGEGGCKRTSFNTYANKHAKGKDPFRKNYATVGGLYDPVRDAFYIESPFSSWVLDEETCQWSPPVAPPYSVTPPDTMPDMGDWYWKDDTTEWVDYYWQEPTSEQPFPSWTYDGVNWIPPIPYPDPENTPRELFLFWDEETKTWKEI